MKFIVKYTKLTHQFFYLQNMSLWRPWCHKEYNDAWSKITGSLSRKEEKVIREFKDIISKPGKFNEIFDYIYNKEIFPLEKHVQEIFTITEKNFEKIWENIENDLPKAKKNLEFLIAEYSEQIETAMKKLSIFYNSQKEIPLSTKIYLILFPKSIKSGGGKFGTYNNVVLEGNLKRFSQPITIEVLLHEMVHLYFEDYLKTKIYPKFEKEIDYHPLKETIVATLLPHGYLSKEIFNVALNQTAKNYLIIQIAEDYIKSHKSIDDEFIKLCLEFIKK